MDGYIFLNDHETFSGLNGALFINEDNGAFDLQKLLQRVAADAPHLLKECEVECPESVLDELDDEDEENDADDVCEHFNMPNGKPGETIECPDCKGKATFETDEHFEMNYNENQEG